MFSWQRKMLALKYPFHDVLHFIHQDFGGLTRRVLTASREERRQGDWVVPVSSFHVAVFISALLEEMRRNINLTFRGACSNCFLPRKGVYLRYSGQRG
jgi:hypothetical protein